MASFNSCTFTGYVGKDPECKYFESGTAVAEFSIAISYPKRKGGEEKEALWLSVKVWGKQVDNVANLIKKGSHVLLQGELEQETWEKDGDKRSKLVLSCRSFQLLDSKSQAGGNASGGGAKSSSKPKGRPPEEDEIPF
jgi:single-strand DNA-binding protein